MSHSNPFINKKSYCEGCDATQSVCTKLSYKLAYLEYRYAKFHIKRSVPISLPMCESSPTWVLCSINRFLSYYATAPACETHFCFVMTRSLKYDNQLPQHIHVAYINPQHSFVSNFQHGFLVTVWYSFVSHLINGLSIFKECLAADYYCLHIL
jgi:hypothetical protein